MNIPPTAAFLAGWLMLAAPALAQNLIPDPSFEVTQAKDKDGRVFPQWDGWIYSTPARFEVGSVTHSGTGSCEMVVGRGGLARIYTKKFSMAPGRYRLQAFLRGMDIAPGAYGVTVDFSVTRSNAWFDLKGIAGTFGWTPLTYVFDWPANLAAQQARVYLGLETAGRLWVDDVTIEPVGTEVPLTAQPMFGSEEVPIAPPGPLPAHPVRCSTCGYHNDLAWSNCFACGYPLEDPAADPTVPPVEVMADFEANSIFPFSASSGFLETQQSIAGTGSLRIDTGYAMNARALDWSRHDYVLVDAFNPSVTTKTVYIEVQDAQSKDYWSRANFFIVVPPGLSTLRFPTRLRVGEKARPGRYLIRHRVTRFAIGLYDGGPLMFDNIRLEKLDTSAHTFPELQAFDFGPLDSPPMGGFFADTGLPYREERGYGFLEGSSFWRDYDVLQPEPLTEDFITPQAATFRLKLSNGFHRVVMNVDSPGGYWGEPQAYRTRKLVANGLTVHNETVSFADFMAKYFRDAGAEDLPGVDPFDRYVQDMFTVRSFTAEVTNGYLDLVFSGATWAHCLTHLVTFPAGQQAQGDSFLAWVEGQRKQLFDDYFKPVTPVHRGSAAPSSGYRVFHRSAWDPVYAYDGPAAGDTEAGAGILAQVAAGEEGTLTFAVQPGEDLGALDLVIPDLYSAAGDRLPATNISPGWIDYRLTRVTMEGSAYTVAPRYWRPLPASASPGVTRRFWLRVQPPAGTPSGDYSGTILLTPQLAGSTGIPVVVRVWPFDLPPVTNLAVGPFGSSIEIPWVENEPLVDEWEWNVFDRGLDALRAGGFNSFSARPRVSVTLGSSRFNLDTAQADREMALIRGKGFDQLLSGYGWRSLGYTLSTGPTLSQAQQAGYSTATGFLAAIYHALDRHAVASNWLPVAWNLCDEPVGAAIRPAVTNALLHRSATAGLSRITFMGETSMTGNSPSDSHYDLVRALPLSALTAFDEAALDVIHAAGNRFAYYNGGTRWTFGFFMKMLKDRHDLALRLNWHFNVCAGNPYYPLDSREDDYCWFNSNTQADLVPSMDYLQNLLPGLNDYRYLLELDHQLVLAQARRDELTAFGLSSLPTAQALQVAIAAGVAITQQVNALRAGVDVEVPADIRDRREALMDALVALITTREATFHDASDPRLDQTITFALPRTHIVTNGALSLSASASSGLPITFEIRMGPAQLTGHELTPTDEGTVVVRAGQAGDAVWKPAPPSDRILVLVSHDYENWARAKFGAKYEADGGPDRDPDHDGVSNRGEWLGHTDPQLAGQRIVWTSMRMRGDAALEIAHNQGSGLAYPLTFSTDLVNWVEVPAHHIRATTVSSPVRLDVSGANQFYRLEVPDDL